MAKGFFLILFCVLFINTAVFAAASENITITTYYPSPNGSYQDLQVSNNLIMQKSPLGSDSSFISWMTNNANGLNWSLDQSLDHLRFYTNNNSTLVKSGTNLKEVVSLYPETANVPGYLQLQGVSASYDLILKGAANLSEDAGDLIFQSSGGTQKGRIWSEYASTASGLRLSSGDNTADIAIDSTGRVGIGTTSPRAQLDLSGAVGIGYQDISCTSQNKGVTRFNNNKLEVCRDLGSNNWQWTSTGGGELKTKVITATKGSQPIPYVSCTSTSDPGWKLTGGGCYQPPQAVGAEQYLVQSYPSGNGWQCDGGGGNLANSTGFSAFAICAKID